MEGVGLGRDASIGFSAAAQIHHVPLGQILRPSLSGGMLALPLEEGQPFAQFKYVQGIPGAEAGSGFSVSKLHALDVLIEKLVSMTVLSAEERFDLPALDLGGASEDALDQLVAELGEQLARAESLSIAGLQREFGVQMGTPVSHTAIVLDSVV